MQWTIIGATCLCLSAVAIGPPQAKPTDIPSPITPDITFAQKYLEAFNAHDTEAMSTYWAADIHWLDPTAADAKPIVTDAGQLASFMQSYFSSHPDVRSTATNITVLGNFLAFIETATWTAAGTRKSQKALAVLEIRDQKIARFWYFSAD